MMWMVDVEDGKIMECIISERWNFWKVLFFLWYKMLGSCGGFCMRNKFLCVLCVVFGWIFVCGVGIILWKSFLDFMYKEFYFKCENWKEVSLFNYCNFINCCLLVYLMYFI